MAGGAGGHESGGRSGAPGEFAIAYDEGKVYCEAILPGYLSILADANPDGGLEP